jgi:hypothetical protein
MDLSEVKQIAKTDDVNKANKYLKHGWKLIFIEQYATADVYRIGETEAYQYSEMFFILGWLNDGPPSFVGDGQ